MTAGTAGAGPWADDVRRLLTLIESVGERYAAADGHAVGDHAPECAWCPVCQALMLARRAGPDLLDRVAEVAAGLAATIRSDDATASRPEPPTAPSPPGTERIEISD